MLSRVVFIFLVVLNVFGVKSQLTLGGGLSSVGAIDIKNPYVGINLLGEYREDDMAYFARFYSTLPQFDSDTSVQMFNINKDENLNFFLNGTTNYNYNVLEVGKRNFYGKDLEFGFAGYMSSHFSLIMNTLSFKNEAFDQSRYKFPDGYVDKAKIYALAGGINLGAQYALFYGTYFLDFGLNYVLMARPSQSLSQDQFQKFNSYRQFFFVANFGFKKTIFNSY
jgi:hypothetical protein